MKYRESTIDKRLRRWFTNDMNHQLLRRIALHKGVLRGLNSLDIAFDYPIAVIAGKNGSGKSTILALACCAFHNTPSGFKLPKRRNPYYTFSDFFVQHSAEESPQGLVVNYKIAHNNWRKNARFPDGVGVGVQVRRKVKGGKWNNYDSRVPRTVVFLGIDRIVPHSERSQSRSYSKVFKTTESKGWEKDVMAAVGYILGKTYKDFRYLEYSKYSLPIVQTHDAMYSGFNMGAGENALFEIFSTLHAAGDGALIVMDEAELGLHAEAQRRFMEQLKAACLRMHAQVICTTHSKDIFDCLPNDARFYVESVNGRTRLTQGISSDFAFAKMSSVTGLELDIFVEDDVAKSILLESLPASTRARVTITVIGSATALARQLAALYVRGECKPVLAVFDGDQRSKAGENLEHASKMAETPKADFPEWFTNHTVCLPGDVWPEAWLLQKAGDALAPLATVLGSEADKLKDIVEYGQQAGKHNEFHEVARHMGLERAQCLQHFASVICKVCAAEITPVVDKINTILAQNG